MRKVDFLRSSGYGTNVLMVVGSNPCRGHHIVWYKLPLHIDWIFI